MATLGDRIRDLRKQKGLTLQALAGDQLTKGMLSLIENNKANPSMESLSYIAERLEVERNELLEDIPTNELRRLLEEVEQLYTQEIISDELIGKYKEIVEKIKPYIEKMPFRYESARLLEIYSRCSYHAHQDGWQEPLAKAEEIYESLHMINQSADLHIFKAMMSFTEHRYSEALDTLQRSRKTFEARTGVLDPLKKLDFDYYESILYSAVGDAKNSKRLMEEAINYSKEQQLFYRIDALYRLAGFQAILSEDPTSKDYYIAKLRLFADFTDDEEIEAFADAIEIHYLNSFAHDYEKANALIDRNLEKHQEDKIFLFALEKGKALYGMGQLEEALAWLNKHQLWEFLHHPYDLSMHYEKDAYLALIYMKIGKNELAAKHADIAKNLIEPMPDLPYKTFILTVYEQVTS
ncbi:helix-turn-helix transcriptional regulator [Planococcus sp. CPCC 101016]|uniref:helix-turn-helix domain-containing protein n=1 Tax=Planococcus sp. CPCC 101016 TaxID=2599617 RepID=UPI0011B48642|nr:helix-turn-helix transcriptional regulator [Planococcus sp. CPCC 101016]TWT04144.1 helix-turn-helix transcriptional regulator [Planococcus sp. CPCC 101016]